MKGSPKGKAALPPKWGMNVWVGSAPHQRMPTFAGARCGVERAPRGNPARAMTFEAKSSPGGLLSPPPLTADQVEFVQALAAQAEVLERSWSQLDDARKGFEAEKAAWQEQVSVRTSLRNFSDKIPSRTTPHRSSSPPSSNRTPCWR